MIFWRCLSGGSPSPVSPFTLFLYPPPSSSPLSAALCWLFGLRGAYQARRSMFPSNRAFILSLPWQLPISPKESAGSAFPWRWHGDIARQLWTACRDSGPFPFPPLTLLFPLSSSLPMLLLPLCSSFGSNPTPCSVCVCVCRQTQTIMHNIWEIQQCVFPLVFVSICQSSRAACYLTVTK